MEIEGVVAVLAGTVVVGFCAFLLGLALLIFVAPAVAQRFLMSFAATARAHYVEQALRLIVGWGLITHAGAMWFSDAFRVFGWLVVVSTIGLLVTPWRRHRQFAMLVMPTVVRHQRLFACGAGALGGFVLYSLSRVVL